MKVVVVGDSFTSGEGADSGTYRRVPSTETTEDGISYDTYKVDPAHQSSTAPSLQALNQIQAANPNVELQVSFVPVSGATRPNLYQTTRPGTPFEQPAQINAVKDADVVIVGVGGNDAKFTNWVKTALSSTDSTSTQEFPKYMQQFNDGSYLAGQVKLLNDVADLASPHAAIISLGYPKAMPTTIPNQPTWYSPFSWSTISQNEATESNQLASILSETNQHAASIASVEHSGQQFIFADIGDALKGHELFSKEEGLNGLTPSNVAGSYHPNDLGQRLLGNALQPQVEKAINDQLEKLGVKGPENVPLITQDARSPWSLKITIPLGMVDKHGKDLSSPEDKPTPPGQQDPAKPTDQQPWGTPPDGKQPDDTPPDGKQPAQQDPAQPTDQPPGTTTPDGTPPTQQDPAQPTDQPPVQAPQGESFNQQWDSLSQALAGGSSAQSLEALRQTLQGPPPEGISPETWNSAINALQGITPDTPAGQPTVGDQPAAGTPADTDPAAPPAADPVAPPAADPVAPPAVDPVTPPAVDPVMPPAVDPVAPPAVAPVTPPAVDPVTPPVADPVTTSPAAPPVIIDPVITSPAAPPAIVDPVPPPPPPVIEPVPVPVVDPITSPGSSISDPIGSG
ncbi:MAG: SGNH/GDSL hydrolase family protein, partial [Actinoallomurus sp.]